MATGVLLVTTDQQEALSDIIPMTADLAYPGHFPSIGIEQNHQPAQAYELHGVGVSSAMDTPQGNIDYTSWGNMGDVDRFEYSTPGPVDPNTVENFHLAGQVLPGQRRPEYGDGPVGAYDHGAYTTAQIAQQMADKAYDEASILSMLMGGV